jgi:two-component system, cell cycle sensor histidine kinase and response regulator CckA
LNSYAAEPSAFAGPGPWCRPETILLAEDEAIVRKGIAEVLESAGYQVIVAASSGEALVAFRECLRPVDLLLADVVMPGMSGRDLALQFEGLCPRARALLMSGHTAQLEGCESSPQDTMHLAKPFSADTLLKAVREALDASCREPL